LDRQAAAGDGDLLEHARRVGVGGLTPVHGERVELEHRAAGRGAVQEADVGARAADHRAAACAPDVERRRRGAADELVERDAELGTPAAGTSAQAAGIAMHVHPTAAGSRLAIRSAELVARLAADTGRALDVHRAGSLKIARTAAHAAIVADEIAFGRSLGV